MLIYICITYYGLIGRSWVLFHINICQLRTNKNEEQPPIKETTGIYNKLGMMYAHIENASTRKKRVI